MKLFLDTNWRKVYVSDHVTVGLLCNELELISFFTLQSSAH